MSKVSGAIRQLKFQHTLFIVILTLAIAGSIIYANAATIASNEGLERNGSVVVVLLSVAFLLVGFNLFKKNMMQARNSQESADIRTRKYANACIRWWLLIYIPALVALAFFLLTAYYSFLAMALLHWLILLVFLPRKANIAMLLRLTEKDLQ